MSRCKILYDLDRSESRPFMIARRTLDRRKSNIVWTVLGSFHEYADAARALPGFNSQPERRGDLDEPGAAERGLGA